jgi:hypothetical protein
MTPAELLASRPAKVKLEGERQRYSITASNNRFVIMTKPFNAQRTYLYTIADLERGVRGPCNRIFGLPCDVNTPEGAAEALRALDAGEMEVSYRRCVDLSPADAEAISAALRARTAAEPSTTGDAS